MKDELKQKYLNELLLELNLNFTDSVDKYKTVSIHKSMASGPTELNMRKHDNKVIVLNVDSIGGYVGVPEDLEKELKRVSLVLSKYIGFNYGIILAFGEAVHSFGTSTELAKFEFERYGKIPLPEKMMFENPPKYIQEQPRSKFIHKPRHNYNKR